MSSSPTAAPEAPAAGLTQLERVTNTFFAPSKTMADIARSASWWLPFVLLVLGGLAMNLTLATRIGWPTVVDKQMNMTPKMTERMEKLDPEKRQEAIDGGIRRAKTTPYTAPIFQLLFLVVCGAVVLAIGNFVFGARLRYSQSLAITAYGFLPLVLNSIFVALTLFFIDPDGYNVINPVMTNPAAFMDFGNSNKLLYSLLSGFDVFTLWSCWLIGIGISKHTKVKSLTAAATVFCVFLLIIKLGGGTLMSMFM